MTAAEIQSTTQAVLNLIEALPLPVRAKVVEAVRQEYQNPPSLILPEWDEEAEGLRMSVQDFEQVYQTFRQTGVADLSQGEIVK